MSPLDNPVLRAEADKIIAAAKTILQAAEQYGLKSIQFLTILLTTMMTLTSVAGNFLKLDAVQKKLFLAELWDSGIGDEETALVQQFFIFEGEALERLSDGFKAGFVAYAEKNIAGLLPAPPE